MFRSTTLCLAATLLATLALAQTTESRQRIEVAGATVPLPDAATMSAMTGEFALADGRALRVSRPGLHLMAAVGRRWGVALEPVGPNLSAWRDGRLVVAFYGCFDTLTVIENASVSVASRGTGTSVQ